MGPFQPALFLHLARQVRRLVITTPMTPIYREKTIPMITVIRIIRTMAMIITIVIIILRRIIIVMRRTKNNNNNNNDNNNNNNNNNDNNSETLPELAPRTLSVPTSPKKAFGLGPWLPDRSRSGCLGHCSGRG